MRQSHKIIILALFLIVVVGFFLVRGLVKEETEPEEKAEPVLSESGGWPVLEGVYVEDDGPNVTLTNSQISFTLTKSSATIISLTKKGDYEEENLFEGGRGYYLLNYVLDGQKSETGLSGMTYELISQTKDRVVWIIR